ncbi:DNA polymerase III subunit beta [Pseudarthrobacter sp. NIBRBAC000502770]|uniref:DNA polymerase III subunit beta n=1 Tax=Pseudarthrobacter sp. NIBRBAC000502770 TaxID=2590785 RepID=UPI0011405CB4|nr:DNA polymerase III subunit beta [Pseudarthrobacter sp. NIBRBAC000502770]QDG87145.1 DNA polymerase III subunit beta [Pseudarthrobacter sp. NIBRBAC000502770]
MSTQQAITAPAKDWIAALNRVAPALAGKKPLPVLYGVHIDPSAGVLSAFDYDTSCVTTVAEAEGEGTPFLVTYRWLIDAIRTTTGKTKAAPVTVAIEGEKVTVSACGYELHAQALPVAEYPEIPDLAPSEYISVPAADFRAALRRVSIAASKDDTLPILTAVRIAIGDGAMELLATDRYRLAEDHVQGQGEGSADFLLNYRTIKALDRFLTGDDVVIGLRDRRITIKTEHATFTSMSVDGDYPKIKSLFPADVTASFEVDRAVLLESAKVAERMNERFSPCFVRMFDGGAEVTFDYGLFGPSKAPVAWGGVVAGLKDDIKFALSPRYLVETLQQLPGDKVRISYTSAPKPFLFSPGGLETNDPKSSKHLIMPVRMPS